MLRLVSARTAPDFLSFRRSLVREPAGHSGGLRCLRAVLSFTLRYFLVFGDTVHGTSVCRHGGACACGGACSLGSREAGIIQRRVCEGALYEIRVSHPHARWRAALYLGIRAKGPVACVAVHGGPDPLLGCPVWRGPVQESAWAIGRIREGRLHLRVPGCAW